VVPSRILALRDQPWYRQHDEEARKLTALGNKDPGGSFKVFFFDKEEVGKVA
jgi:hypothetical protein